MRTVALCLRQERIAPRYDQPEHILLVTFDAAGKETSRTLHPVVGLSKEAICKMILEMHVDLIICGGILPDCQAALTRAGVRYIDNVIGSCDAALEAYAAHRLLVGDILD